MNEASRFLFLPFPREKLRDPYSWCLTLSTAVSDDSHSLLSKNEHNCYDLAHCRKYSYFCFFMISLNFHTKFASMNYEYTFGYGTVKYSIYSHLETFVTKQLLNFLLHMCHYNKWITVILCIMVTPGNWGFGSIYEVSRFTLTIFCQLSGVFFPICIRSLWIIPFTNLSFFSLWRFQSSTSSTSLMILVKNYCWAILDLYTDHFDQIHR